FTRALYYATYTILIVYFQSIFFFILFSFFFFSSFLFFFFFFFNDTATTEIYTLSLHDALPISVGFPWTPRRPPFAGKRTASTKADRKSTRLNSSHDQISYAVFCLKKKKKKNKKKNKKNKK